MKPTTYAVRIELLGLLNFVAVFGLPVVVFVATGGHQAEVTTWFDRAANHDGLAMTVPMRAALLTFLSLLLVSSVAVTQARLAERRAARNWFAMVHPEDMPDQRAVETTQKLLRAEGPLTPMEIREKLREGGEWGSPVRLSAVGLAKMLLPGGKPAGWLMPALPGWPCSVPENPYAPPVAAPAEGTARM